jgi:hypothetical protein
MRSYKRVNIAGVIAAALVAGAASSAQAQAQGQTEAKPLSLSGEPATPWVAEFSIGWDNSISGNINSSGMGRLNNTAVVITKNKYEDVYGTGLQIRFGGGYMLDENTELRGMFSFQSLDADLTPMGDFGVSRLYGQYDDYQAFALDFGYRKYRTVARAVRLYGEGTIGLGFIDETDVVLAAPAVNTFFNATDFYDKTTAFTLGGNGGVLFQTSPKTGIFAQLGLRWTSGMSEVDGLEGTGLDNINDKSARWTFPFLVGARFRF